VTDAGNDEDFMARTPEKQTPGAQAARTPTKKKRAGRTGVIQYTLEALVAGLFRDLWEKQPHVPGVGFAINLSYCTISVTVMGFSTTDPAEPEIEIV
jgi:hypothetical protein